MITPLISIIMPVYNAEKHLNQCIDSVLAQSLHDFELICVNDGSSDNSRAILDSYANKDSRIIIIDKENTGAGDSRNVGLEKSKGDFVIFLDSDDTFSPHLLKKLHSKITKTDSDICFCNYHAYEEGIESFKTNTPEIPNPFNIDDTIPGIFQVTHPVPWNKMYNANFIKGTKLKFSRISSSNDISFVYSSLIMAKKISFVPDSLISYQIVSTSITKGKSNKIDNALLAYDELFKTMKKLSLSEQLMPSFYASLNETLRYYLSLKLDSACTINQFDFLNSEEWITYQKQQNSISLCNTLVNKLPFISIVIPVYNSANYVGKTLQHLIDQSFPNIEVLCINDGSTDDSLQILEQFASEDSRIRVFSQPNSGPAKARNVGLTNARAPYLMFCDSDDWYEPTMCEELLKAILYYKVDFAMCDSISIEEDENHYRNQSTIEYHKLKLFGYISLDQNMKRNVTVLLWNKIFDLGIIRKYGISFPDGYEHDDAAFIWQYICCSKSAYGLNKKLYNYLLRGNSIMGNLYSQKTKHKIYDVIDALAATVRFTIKNDIFDENLFMVSRVLDQTKWFTSFLNYNEKLRFLTSLNEKVLSQIDIKYLAPHPLLKACKNKKYRIALHMLDGLYKFQLFGITIFKEKKQGEKSKYYLFNIPFLKKKKNDISTKYYLFGIKIFSHKKSLYRHIDNQVHHINNALNGKVSYLNGRISMLEKQISSLENKQVDLGNQFEEKTSLISQYEHKISSTVNAYFPRIQDQGYAILGELRSAKRAGYIYKKDFEKDFIKKYYPDFSIEDRRLYDLLVGLDEKSAGTVIKIVTRLDRLIASGYEDIDIYSPEEKLEQETFDREFWGQIIKISEDIYAYNKWFLPKKHFELSVFYNKHCLNALDHPSRIANKSIMDVGGYIGDSALILQELQPSRIYSFEANPENITLMQKTLELNRVENVSPVQLALGDTEGEIFISIDDSVSSCLTQDQEGIATKSVKMDTLDHFVESNKINDVGLIKVDIEGFEQTFLKGAEKTIRKFTPTLLLSIYHNWDDFLKIKPIIESWNLGYKFKVVKPIDKNIVLETLLIAEIP